MAIIINDDLITIPYLNVQGSDSFPIVENLNIESISFSQDLGFLQDLSSFSTTSPAQDSLNFFDNISLFNQASTFDSSLLSEGLSFITVASFDSATLLENNLIAIPVFVSDSITLQEQSNILTNLSASDSSSLVENSLIFGNYFSFDNNIFSDNSSVQEEIFVSDQSTLNETIDNIFLGGIENILTNEFVLISVVEDTSDSIVFEDLSSFSTTSPAQDSSTVTDNASLSINASAQDLTGLSEQNLNISLSSMENGVFNENELTVSINSFDSGLLNETSSYEVNVTSPDSSSFSDTALEININPTDTSLIQENVLISTNNSSVDSSALTEDNNISIQSSDTLALVDSSNYSALLISVENVLLAEGVSQSIVADTNDTSSLIETSGFSADNPSQDSGSFSDQTFLFVNIFNDDSASLEEKDLLISNNNIFDSFVLSEFNNLIASIQNSDSINSNDGILSLIIQASSSDAFVNNQELGNVQASLTTQDISNVFEKTTVDGNYNVFDSHQLNEVASLLNNVFANDQSIFNEIARINLSVLDISSLSEKTNVNVNATTQDSTLFRENKNIQLNTFDLIQSNDRASSIDLKQIKENLVLNEFTFSFITTDGIKDQLTLSEESGFSADAPASDTLNLLSDAFIETNLLGIFDLNNFVEQIPNIEQRIFEKYYLADKVLIELSLRDNFLLNQNASIDSNYASFDNFISSEKIIISTFLDSTDSINLLDIIKESFAELSSLENGSIVDENKGIETSNQDSVTLSEFVVIETINDVNDYVALQENIILNTLSVSKEEISLFEHDPLIEITFFNFAQDSLFLVENQKNNLFGYQLIAFKERIRVQKFINIDIDPAPTAHGTVTGDYVTIETTGGTVPILL